MTTPSRTVLSASPEPWLAAYEECRRVTRREARNFYFAFLTLPARQRRAIYVAYTFCRYCDDSVDAEGTDAEKLQRIEYLRGKLTQAYSGNPDQPLFIGLADVAATYGDPRAVLPGGPGRR